MAPAPCPRLIARELLYKTRAPPQCFLLAILLQVLTVTSFPLPPQAMAQVNTPPIDCLHHPSWISNPSYTQ